MTDGERPDLIEGPRARRSVAIAVVGAAVLGSVAVPGVPPGLGISIVAVAVGGAVALARPAELDNVSMVYAGFALLLAAAPALRSAEWLVAIDLLAATALGALAVTRAVEWRQVFRAPLSVLRRMTGALLFTLGPLLPGPGLSRRLGPALRGAGLGGLLLLVFGTLFASADPAFAEIAGDLLIPDIDLSLLPARIAVFGFVLLGGGALILAGPRYARTTEGEGMVTGDTTRRLGRVEWVTALALLDLMFAGFVAVQLAVFFGGREHVLRTTGLTYAEYARQGFFQLAAVGALTFVVIAGTVRWARRESKGETLALQVLLGALSLFTLVVLASAFRRLTLYESVFGYTRLRLSVHTVILWMAVLFVALLVAGVTMRARWLPRFAVIVSSVGLVAFTVANPDRLIASENVERYLDTGRIDLPYLASLSPDAVPALAKLSSGLAQCAFWPHAYLAPGGDRIVGAAGEAAREARSLFGWSYGRALARRVMPANPPAAEHLACERAIARGVWP